MNQSNHYGIQSHEEKLAAFLEAVNDEAFVLADIMGIGQEEGVVSND